MTSIAPSGLSLTSLPCDVLRDIAHRWLPVSSLVAMNATCRALNEVALPIIRKIRDHPLIGDAFLNRVMLPCGLLKDCTYQQIKPFIEGHFSVSSRPGDCPPIEKYPSRHLTLEEKIAHADPSGLQADLLQSEMHPNVALCSTAHSCCPHKVVNLPEFFKYLLQLGANPSGVLRIQNTFDRITPIAYVIPHLVQHRYDDAVFILLEAYVSSNREGAAPFVSNPSNPVDPLYLYKMAALGMKKCTELLFEQRLHVGERNTKNFLHHAAENGRPDLIELAVSNGAVTQLRDSSGKTPMHYAAMGGHVDCVRALLRYTSITAPQDSLGRLPMHLAAQSGSTACLELLIKKAKSLDTQDGLGQTPLHIAAMKGHVGCVDLLLQKGASAIVKTSPIEGQTPIEYAYLGAKKAGSLSEAHTQCLELLVKSLTQKQKDALLITAASRDQYLIFDCALTNGANPNAKQKSSNGHTVLHICATNMRLAFIQRLFSGNNPPDLNLADGQGQASIGLLVSFLPSALVMPNLYPCLAFLAEQLNPQGLHNLIMSLPQQQRYCLIAELNSRTLSTRFIQALEAGYTDIARNLFQQAGLDLNRRNSDEDTLLHFFAKNSQFFAAYQLIALGANPTLQDHQGQTPFDIIKKSPIPQNAHEANWWAHCMRLLQPPQRMAEPYSKRPKREESQQ